jgi:hypothetical protein
MEEGCGNGHGYPYEKFKAGSYSVVLPSESKYTFEQLICIANYT